MNYEGTRTIEFRVSADNIRSEIETMLRRYKVLTDADDVEDFGHVFKDIDFKLKIKQRKAVETINYNGETKK